MPLTAPHELSEWLDDKGEAGAEFMLVAFNIAEKLLGSADEPVAVDDDGTPLRYAVSIEAEDFEALTEAYQACH